MFQEADSLVVFIDMPTEEDEYQALEVILKVLIDNYSVVSTS